MQKIDFEEQIQCKQPPPTSTCMQLLTSGAPPLPVTTTYSQDTSTMLQCSVQMPYSVNVCYDEDT